MTGATILQIVPRLDTGGAELTTVQIAQALVAAGGRALVVTEGGSMGADIERAGGRVIAFPAATKNPARMLANGFALARLIRREGVDLVHARSRAPAWSALWAARMTGVPFVTTYHGAYGSIGPLKTFYNGVMARGDAVIANSRFTADLLRARHGTPAERVRVIYRGVDLERFDPDRVAPERVAALRAAWGLEGSQRAILHAARLTHWKGHHVVIDAARMLAKRGALDDARFVLAGDAQGRNAYAADLQRRIDAHGLADAVRLVGHCRDMPAAFAAAHVALVPSIEPEAFGRTSAEAQALGCPVIASRLGASTETVQPAAGAEPGTGWLVAPNDAAALADAIAEALTLSDQARDTMGRRARAHVVRNFSLDAMCRATLGLYDALLGTELARGQ